QKVTPPGTARADWIIAAELAAHLGGDLGLEALDDIWSELAVLSPVHTDVDPAAAVDRDGVLVTGTLDRDGAEPLETPSLDAYALRLISTRAMYDQGTTLGASSSSAGLHRSPSVALNPVDFERLGVAEGDVVAVTSARATLRLPARADVGVPRGCAATVSHLDLSDAYDLIDITSPVTDVRVERIS
ncbi:MAG: molybdopterin dinucleotide binding domain-containing protein, partial [Acidimicrobiales bacterium]